MNLREMQQKKQKEKEQEQITEISKNTTQKLETPSAEQMMLSKMKELTEALETSKQLLQDEKQEKEGYLQELETEKNRNSTLSFQNTELKKVLEESQSKHRSEVQKLQIELRTVLRQNDDLRNKEGLKTRSEIEKILKKNQELEKSIAEKNRFIDMSNVNAVMEAESDARNAWYMAGLRIRENNEEYIKRTKEAERKAEEAIKRSKQAEETADFYEDVSNYSLIISCGILSLFVLIESVIHRGFWKDLIHFFYVPARWVFSNWLALFSNETKELGFLLWIGRIGIPIAVIGGIVSLIGVVLLTIKRRCLITFVFIIVCTGAAVILGDFLPFNRFIVLSVLTVIYHVVYTCIEHKCNAGNT